MNQDSEFAGRIALVTGGNGGIGGAVAAALRQAGATVISADIGATRSPGECAFVRDQSIEVRLDVTRKTEIEHLLTRIDATLGGIDILVNVAGVVSFGSAATLDESEWDRVLAINLKGTFLCCQAVMPAMKRAGFGRIVNIGSVIGKNGGNPRPWLAPEEQSRAGNVAYGVSKAGVHTLTSFLAKELAAHGVTVNAVAPGPIATGMTSGFPDSLKALIPVGRMGRLDDVVRAVLFLASPAAGFINGEVLDVNGGSWCD